MIPEEILKNPDRLRHYQYLRSQKFSEANAARLATGYLFGQAIQTDATFLAGRKPLRDQFKGDEKAMRYRIAQAKKHGIHPTHGYVYDPCLASAPGAPDGWIPPDDARGHVKRVLEQKGVEVDAHGIKTRAAVKTPKEKVPLASRIVDRMVAKACALEPKLATKKAELREEIIAKHGKKG